MKTFLLPFFLYLSISAQATTYYFSSLSGNDSRTSAEAKNPTTPWKTLSKLNSFFSSLRPGDSVLFKRGETFYGSLSVKASGTISSPIVISAYGSGNKPVITSLITLSNWVSVGNGIWESYNASLGTTLNDVLSNNILQQQGRYPNADAPNNGYLIFESHSGKTSITDNEFTSTTNWAGAELVLRTRRWILDRNLITSNSGNTIYYSTATGFDPYDKQGYFIQNSIKTLDQLGEWYYKPSTKKLSVYFGTSSPSSYIIQATTIDNLVSSTNFSNIIFDNLNIKGANSSGFYISGGSNIRVKNCDIFFSGKTGVIVNSHSQADIENCIVSNSNNNGIDLGYSSNSAIVKNNKILNTSSIAGMGLSGDVNGIAIFSFGDGNLIEANEIRNVGYSAMYFNGNDVTIKNNLIDSFCVVKDDGAGIYTNSGTSRTYRRKLTGNIVLHGLGAGPGTDNPVYFPATGIYMDNNSSATEISGNTLAFCKKDGIYIHNAGGMIIKNNTLFNNTNQISMIEGSDNDDPIRNTTITNNILFSKLPDQMITYLKSAADDIGIFGRFDSNYYARPLDDRITIYNQYVKTTGNGVTQKFALDGWQEKYDEDKYSKKTAKQIAPYNLNGLVGSNKFSNGLFNASISGVKSSSCTSSFSLLGLLDGGYLQIVPSAKTSSVYMSIGAITAGKKYILRYTIKGSVDSSMVMSTFLRQEFSPYTPLTPLQNREVSTARADNEMIFVAPSSQTSATVVFQVNEQSKYYLDNVQVYEANATITNIDDSLRFEYNSSAISKTINLDGSYVDAIGNKFAGSINLAPYTSVILIADNSIVNSAPTVSITSPAVNTNYTDPATIKLTASAFDADGSITKVEFLYGSSHLYTSYSAPYTCTWKNAPAGNYVFTAKATDNNGAVTVSKAVAVSVVKQPASRSAISVSRNDSSALSDFKLLPNPAINTIQLSFDTDVPIYQKANLSIYNASGALLKRNAVIISGQKLNVDVSSLSIGAYIISLSTDKFTINKKFLKVSY